MPRPLAVFLTILLSAAACAAPPLPVALEARIAPEASQTFTVNVPPEALQRKLALSLLARLESPNLGGSTYTMVVTVNGKPLDPNRLLNKLLDAEMQNGLQLAWYGTGRWRVAYSPDYEAANRTDHPMCLLGGHAYDFIFDVSDLLKPGPNTILIRHAEPLIKNDLVLKDLQLVDAPPRVLPSEPEDAPEGELRLIAPKPHRPVPYQLQILPGGAMKVTSGKLALTVTSSFSYPSAGWNVLGDKPAEQDLILSPMVAHGGQFTLQGRGKSYELKRVVRRLPDHIAVSDTLTNLTPADLHISLKYMISTAGLSGTELYLRGLKSRLLVGYERGGDNPSTYLRQGEDGLGMVAEDDVLRAQCAQSATADPAEAGLLDHYFMLAPKASYTVRWSLYPTPAGDYFDFVNAVRRNWGTNFTIPGGFAFAPHPTHVKPGDDLKSWLENGALNIVSLQIPMPEPRVLAHGLAFLREPSEQQRLKAQADLLRSLKPGLKVLQYLHVYITRLDEAVQQYADARHLGADGKQLQYPAGNWKPTFWLFLPTTTNAYGREMNKTFDLVCDTLGFDGVYWDELSHSARDLAYGVHDGYSALPDMKTMTVQERVALTPLYCQAYQVQQARRVLEAGKLLIGNGQPVTETMTKLHFPRFVEAWQPGNLRYAHLYCPLGLSSPDRIHREADLVPSVRSHLQYGGLWYHYYSWDNVKLTRKTVTEHLFPFTPIELHEGYVIGQERILTAKSGLFGWGDRSGHRVFAYAADGLQVTGYQAPQKDIAGATYSEVRVPKGGVVVIERVRR